jgi:hypothetical protein
LRPPRIAFALFGVLAPVDFDHDLQGMTCEIDDVTAQVYLATKVSVRQCEAITQMPPQFALRVSRSEAHGAATRLVDWDDAAVAPRPDSFFVF